MKEGGEFKVRIGGWAAAAACGFLASVGVTPPASARPEAIEVTMDTRHLLPKGKEADGIVGDFVLRNGVVEALISHNAPLRKANMGTYWGDGGITPGCLYDLCLRGSDNDQITIFSPSDQRGGVSYVRVTNPGDGEEASVETVVTAALNKGVTKRHRYLLREGWSGVMVVTTLRNTRGDAVKLRPNDRWTNFARTGWVSDLLWADSVDPSHKAGYAYGWVEHEGLPHPPGEIELAPGQQVSYARFLAVGTSPLAAAGHLAAMRGEPGKFVGTVRGPTGAPVPSARIDVTVKGKTIPGYPDAKGRFSFFLPPGKYPVRVSDIGRDHVDLEVDIPGPGETVEAQVDLSSAAAIAFDIRDAEGRSLPCKAQFIGIGDTPSPDLGPTNRAHGCKDQYHSETGQFRVNVPRGRYRVVVTRGIEYAHLAREVEAEPGRLAAVSGTLERLVDTPGWVSTDYHNHSTPSGDNVCGTDDRVINLAAEHIEFAPTTEHNRLYDWAPHIERLGLSSWISTVSGMELTGSGAHFNAFPFTPAPHLQDGGAPVWQKDPRLNAIVLREFQGRRADRWVHLNHPNMVEDFVDRDRDGRADGGYVTLGSLLDGLETQNFVGNGILSPAPFRIAKDRTGNDTVREVREFVWLQLLNRGLTVWGIAVADAHHVHGNGVGGWRTYVQSSTDDPAKVDWAELSRRSKAGRMMLTTGPYLEVETADGVIAGGHARAEGSIDLKVKVQCTDWVDIDRVQVLVNGRQRPDLNFTRKSHPDWFGDGVVKFDRTVNVPLSEDAHLIVVAIGENHDLKTGYGSSTQASMNPCAYHNPIFVDVDGGGFQPNGDDLGFRLPVKNLSVEAAKAMLKAAGG